MPFSRHVFVYRHYAAIFRQMLEYFAVVAPRYARRRVMRRYAMGGATRVATFLLVAYFIRRRAFTIR